MYANAMNSTKNQLIGSAGVGREATETDPGVYRLASATGATMSDGEALTEVALAKAKLDGALVYIEGQVEQLGASLIHVLRPPENVETIKGKTRNDIAAEPARAVRSRPALHDPAAAPPVRGGRGAAAASRGLIGSSVNCPDCTRAAAEPWWGFRMGCAGCCARSVSRSPKYDAVRANGVQDRKYRDLLAQLGTTHEAVKVAASADYPEEWKSAQRMFIDFEVMIRKGAP